jgi:hypothetical protein
VSRYAQALLTLGELADAGLIERIEVVSPNPDRVVHELVADGAVKVDPVNSHERVLTDKSIVRYREGRVSIAGVPVVVKTTMTPLSCRSPEVA